MSKESILIAACDPGKLRDSFGFIIIEIKDKEVYIRSARRWIGTPYRQIVQDIVGYHERFGFDRIVVERNSVGESVVEHFKEFGLHITGVFTSKNLKDEKKKQSSTIMDKNEMVLHIASLKQNGKIHFIKHGTRDMEELNRQISNFVMHITESGQVSYHAEGNEHDDLVMALILACFAGRIYLKRRSKRKVVSIKPGYHEDYDIFRSDEIFYTGGYYVQKDSTLKITKKESISNEQRQQGYLVEFFNPDEFSQFAYVWADCNKP